MWKKLAILVICLVLLAVGLHVIQAQDNTELPPQIVEVWPFSGIEISPYETLVVTFDQPMDHRSVEDAFSIDPVVLGTFFWSDLRTVQFAPDVPWPAATTYTISIDSTARAENNLTLESPYLFEVTTAPPLQVISVSPEPGTTDVDPRGVNIIVSFDRPVVELGPASESGDLPTPVIIEPALEGEGEWLNTFIYSFRSTKWSQGGMEYTARVPAGLMAVDGSVMAESYVWTFTVEQPLVQSIRLKDSQQLSLLDTEIEVYFSQPMDTTSTEAAFSLLDGEQSISGTFEWSAVLTSLTFVPDADLVLDTSYSVIIDTTAQGQKGGNLDARYTFDFKTLPYPAIQTTDPANNESDIFSGHWVSLDFSTVMNAETFRDKIIISPEPEEWLPEVNNYGDHTRLTLSFAQTEGTTYTVTLLAGTEDIYGNAIQDDYVLTFSTTPPYEAPPTLWMSGSSWPRIVGAYNADTQVSVEVKGPIEVEYSLYRVDPEKLAQRDEYKTGMMRTWTAEYEESSTIEQFNIPLASDTGGALSPGLYALDAAWQVVGQDRGSTSTCLLAVTNVAITVKDTEDKDLIWVTDMVTSQPIADAPVTIYGRDGILTSGRTNADGVFLPAVDLTMDAVVTDNTTNQPQERDLTSYIVVEDAGLYGMWKNSLELKNPTSIAYLYTDRPIYRPGEQVYFRGVIRDRVDMDFSVPDAKTVQIAAGYYYDDSSLYASSLTVSEFGTFSGAIQLPHDLQTGTYYIWLVDFNAPPSTDSNDYPFDWDAYSYHRRYFLNQIKFEVADFRVPEYKISVMAEQAEIIQGEPITFLAQAQYYAGGPVNDARVDWSTFANAATFEYAGPTQYSFYDSTLSHWVTDLDIYRQETTETGEDGHYSFTTTQTSPPERVPVRLTVSATVSDESGIPVSGTAEVFLHPADVYVGLRSPRCFTPVEDPVEVEIITVTPHSELQPEQVVTLEVVEIRWEKQPVAHQYGRYTREYKEIPVADAQIITETDGTANYTFSAPNAGTYRVRAVTQDAQGRTNSSTLIIYVIADNTTQVDWGQAHYSYRYGNHGLVMASDQESYKPGETAEILIANPLGEPATALISMERAGVIDYDVVAVTESSLVYSLPIEHAYAPAVHVHVVLVRGISEENPDPAYLMNSLRLTVEPVARRLNVSITPSTEQTAPGETLTFEICVTDYDNQAVQAELGLALVDEAVLALKPSNSISLEDRFYSPDQPDYVWTTTSLSAVTIPQQGDRMGMGGGDGTYDPIPPVRDDFVYTPLWAPHVVTGADGCASTSLTMPDNLTEWRLDVRIVTPDMKIAQTETGIVSFIPLMIRPATPRFFIVGDHVRLDAIVNNYTGSDQTVETTLLAEGVQIDDETTQTVYVAKDNRALVSWWVTVEDVDGVDLTFAAASTGGHYDAAKPALRTGPGDTIPAYSNTTPDIVGTSGALFTSDARLELINVPSHLSDLDGQLTVRLEPSLASAIIDALNFLKVYPHSCIEQTVSRFLPAVVTFRAVQDLNITGLVDESELRETVNTALEKLVIAQNEDGGWGWFGGMESNETITAYVLYGLNEARNVGFHVDETMFDSAVGYLIDHWVQPEVNTSGWELNQQAFQLYALAHTGYFDLDRYTALLDKRSKMSHTGRAYMIMAAHTALPEEPALTNALVNDLVSAATLSATGAHWENTGTGWASDTRSTAVVLKALLQVDPDNPLLPNVVNWLMTARQGDPWRTTQENAWAILALTDWMVMTGELESDYAYMVRLNHDVLGQGVFTPDSPPDSWSIPTHDLAPDRANALTVGRGEGSGALYYTAHLDLALPLSEAESIDRGIAVQRSYYSPHKVALVPSADPLTQGEVVLVRLTFTLAEDVYFFALEDPLPSGAEIVDPELMTTDPALSALQRYDTFWFWASDYIDHVEMRDNQMNLYADFLPRGSYTFTYAITLTTIGEFQVLPARAYAFYSPEVFGRSKSDVFIVSEQAPIVPFSEQG